MKKRVLSIIVLSITIIITTILVGCNSNVDDEKNRERAEDFAVRHIMGRYFIPFAIDETVPHDETGGFEIFLTSIDGTRSESIIVYFEGDNIRGIYHGYHFRVYWP